jgi:hypothetical protein
MLGLSQASGEAWRQNVLIHLDALCPLLESPPSSTPAQLTAEEGSSRASSAIPLEYKELSDGLAELRRMLMSMVFQDVQVVNLNITQMRVLIDRLILLYYQERGLVEFTDPTYFLTQLLHLRGAVAYDDYTQTADDSDCPCLSDCQCQIHPSPSGPACRVLNRHVRIC